LPGALKKITKTTLSSIRHYFDAAKTPQFPQGNTVGRKKMAKRILPKDRKTEEDRQSLLNGKKKKF